MEALYSRRSGRHKPDVGRSCDGFWNLPDRVRAAVAESGVDHARTRHSTERHRCDFRHRRISKGRPTPGCQKRAGDCGVEVIGLLEESHLCEGGRSTRV